MREPHSYSTQAVILKHADFAETDRIITLLTPYKGKLQTVAKGVRRPISKKSGHLDLLCHSQLQLAVGRNLDIITQAEMIEPFLHLRNELWHMTCGFYVGELVDRFLEDRTPHPDVYQLLVQTLRALEADALEWQEQAKAAGDEADTRNTWNVHSEQPMRNEQSVQVGRAPQRSLAVQKYGRTQLLLRYFEIYLLSYIGYEPVLRVCAHCDAELQPVENGFAPALGGALCPNCSHLWAHALSMNALKVLRLLQRTEWAHVPRFRLDARLHLELENAMHGLLRYHLERDLKSWSFLDTVRGVS
jgi:DNA repair protein RecO (recombination protein O)